MDGIPSFVHCSVLRHGNHTLHKKVGVVRPILIFFFGGGGPDPTDPPVVAPLQSATVNMAVNNETSSLEYMD